MIGVINSVDISSMLPKRAFQLPPNFPVLVRMNDLSVLRDPLLYLHKKHLSGGKSAHNTREKDAYGLAGALSYVDQVGKTWETMTLDDWRGYKDDLVNRVSQMTSERLASSTIRYQLRTVANYSKFMAQHGRIESHRFDEDPEFFYVEPRSSQRRVELISAADWPLIRKQLGPIPGSEGFLNDNRPIRDGLAADCGRVLGLRVSEVAALTTAQILNLPRTPEVHDLHVSLLHLKDTKGKYPRDVEIPTWLIRDLVAYINGERRGCIEAAKNFWLKAGTKEPVALFVNGISSGRHVGKPVAADTLAAGFRKAIIAVGLTRLVEKIDPLTFEKFVVEAPKYWFHCLRHTFAVDTYLVAHKAGDALPP